jgi:hypothetical protein
MRVEYLNEFSLFRVADFISWNTADMSGPGVLLTCDFLVSVLFCCFVYFPSPSIGGNGGGMGMWFGVDIVSILWDKDWTWCSSDFILSSGVGGLEVIVLEFVVL